MIRCARLSARDRTDAGWPASIQWSQQCAPIASSPPSHSRTSSLPPRPGQSVATGEQRGKRGRSTRQQLQATRGFSLSHPAHRRPPSQRLRTGLRRTVLPVIDRLGRDTDQATVVASRQAKTVTVGSHPLRREANAFGGAGLRHCGEPALLLLLEESLAACEDSDLASERGDGPSRQPTSQDGHGRLSPTSARSERVWRCWPPALRRAGASPAARGKPGCVRGQRSGV